MGRGWRIRSRGHARGPVVFAPEMTTNFLSYPPIGQHAVISDRRTSALVAADGTINWMCAPDYDGAPVFGALLDTKKGGLGGFRTGEALHRHAKLFGKFGGGPHPVGNCAEAIDAQARMVLGNAPLLFSQVEYVRAKMEASGVHRGNKC